MARVFSYLELASGLPAPRPDVARIANQVRDLPALQSGHAVLIGSAAWGDPSWRSDIDVVAYDCAATSGLRSATEAIRSDYESTSQHIAPKIDIILIGADKEELVERDNMVPGSVPILEPQTTSEVFRMVSVRLGDHLRALAQAWGEPWRSFAAAYASKAEDDSDLVLEQLSAYSAAMASGWRENDWKPGTTLTPSHMEHLGYADGFAVHFVRLILSHQGVYPTPDRRSDIRQATLTLGTLGNRVAEALAPFFAFADQYESLAERIRNEGAITRGEFEQAIVQSAAQIDFRPVEELVWTYRDKGLAP